MPYVVLDKNADVGGTWLENTLSRLPGRHPEPLLQLLVRPARRLAALLLARSPSCTRYFRQCVDEFGIRPNIRFSTEVSSIVCDEETATWTLELVGPGRQGVDAPGQRRDQRRRPAQPAAAARTSRAASSFAGPSFHSARVGPRRRPHRQARRRHRHRLQRRPVRARSSPSRSSTLEIFQRTPNWLFPMPHYHDEVPAGLPVAARARAVLPPVVPLLAVLASRRDAAPDGRGRPGLAATRTRSVERAQRQLRQMLTEAIEAQYPDRPDLLEKVAAAVPAGGQADHRRQRHVGADAAPRQRRR